MGCQLSKRIALLTAFFAGFFACPWDALPVPVPVHQIDVFEEIGATTPGPDLDLLDNSLATDIDLVPAVSGPVTAQPLGSGPHFGSAPGEIQLESYRFPDASTDRPNAGVVLIMLGLAVTVLTLRVELPPVKTGPN